MRKEVGFKSFNEPDEPGPKSSARVEEIDLAILLIYAEKCEKLPHAMIGG